MSTVIPTIPGMPSIAEVAEIERLYGSAAAIAFITRGIDPVTGRVVTPHRPGDPYRPSSTDNEPGQRADPVTR